jgi:hypothetical protein
VQLVILNEAKNLESFLSTRSGDEQSEMFRFAQHDIPLHFGLCRCSGASSFRSSLFRQFAEPTQRDRGLRIVHFMTAVESPDSNVLEAGSFD